MRAVQRRLESLGFKVGTTDGVFGAKTVNAVREFQRANRLVDDGVVGIKTWQKLGFEGSPVIPSTGINKTSSGRTGSSSGRTGNSSGRTGSSSGAVVSAPAPTAEKKARLTFNGSSLCWVWLDGSTAPVCWTAVSGRSGYQTKKHQNLKDKGPLPEGEWLVAQGKYQLMPNRNVFEQAINELGRGGWPGGRVARAPGAGTAFGSNPRMGRRLMAAAASPFMAANHLVPPGASTSRTS